MTEAREALEAWELAHSADHRTALHFQEESELNRLDAEYAALQEEAKAGQEAAHVRGLEDDVERSRSSRPSVRNPILGLPAAQEILTLHPSQRRVLAELLRDVGADASARAELSWRKGKAPMAAYWKAAGVYARHIARAIERS